MFPMDAEFAHVTRQWQQHHIHVRFSLNDLALQELLGATVTEKNNVKDGDFKKSP